MSLQQVIICYLKELYYFFRYFGKINFSIPSIDVSFQSAAEVFKENVVGIFVSGANSDGTAGLLLIKNGTTIVQDPSTAEIDSCLKLQ
jgi:two-component system chemotaxis response regulator CheB